MANQKETGAHPVFVPSSWKLEQMIAAAMAKCDGDIEQAHLAKEARAEARIEVRRDDEHGLIRPWILLIDGIVQRNAVGHIRTFATESAALAAGRAAFSSDKGADRG